MKYIKKLVINDKLIDYKSLFDIEINEIYGLELLVNNLKIEDYYDFYFLFKQKPLNQINSNVLESINLASYKFLIKGLVRDSKLEQILKNNPERYIRYYSQVKDKFPDFIFDIDEEDILTHRKRVDALLQYQYIAVVKEKHDDKYNQFIFKYWDINLIQKYLEIMIKKPWKEFEDYILKINNPHIINNYLSFLKKYYINQGVSKDELHEKMEKEHPNIIKSLLETSSDPKKTYGINFLISYMKDFKQKRWKEAEDIIFNEKNKNTNSYLDYASAIKDPIPEIEHYVSKYDKGSLIDNYFQRVVLKKFNDWEKIEPDAYNFISGLRKECIKNGTIIEFYKTLQRIIHTKRSHFESYLEIYRVYPDIIDYLNDLLDIPDIIRLVKKILKLINNEEDWNKNSNSIKKIFLNSIKNGDYLNNYGLNFLILIREKLDEIFSDNNKIKEIILNTFPNITKIVKDYSNEYNTHELQRITFDILKNKWDLAEELIVKFKLGSFGSSYIRNFMNKQRWPELEEALLDEGNPADCFYYVKTVGVKIPEFEEIINRSRDYKTQYEKLGL